MIKKNKTIQSVFKGVLTAFVLLMFTGSPGATQVKQLTAFNTVSKNERQTVTVDFKDEPLAEALQKLAKLVRVGISYSTQSVPDKSITYSAENADIYQVLGDLFEGTRLYATLSGNRKVIVIKELPEQRAPRQATISGTVYDASTRESLPGASVSLEGTNTGAITDANGFYEIKNVEAGSYTLVASFIGYVANKQSVQVADDDNIRIDISLEPDLLSLEEVVVTGYSTRRRSVPTGSVSRIESRDFNEKLINSPDQALQGRMTGVQVISSSGQPGSGLQIRVRGIGSINAGNSPLYIVDGVQVQSTSSALVQTNVLALLNPDDIESIEVLKDASATALYGAQGSNGVVLINTKQARKGQSEISVSTQIGYNEQPTKIPTLDGPTWTDIMIQGYLNVYKDRGETSEAQIAHRTQQAIDNFGDPATAQTYDWQDELSRAGALHKINVSATTGLDKTRIFLSGSYDFEEGAAIGSDFDRLAFRSNIDHQFTDRFTVASRLSVTSSTSNGVVTGSANIRSPFHGGITQRPIDAIYTDEGGYNHNDVIRINLVQLLNENVSQAKTKQMRGNITGIYELTDNLSFRSQWGVDYKNIRDRFYDSANLPRYAAIGGRVTERFREGVNFNTNQILEYQESFSKHNVNAIGGFEYRMNQSGSIKAHGEQLPNAVFNQLDLTAENFEVSGRSSQAKFAGFLGRIDYNFDNKYFVSGNLRYDGSSRFGAKNQWGLFYSGALAWEMANEEFMSSIDFIDQLKFKVSYGITGNSSIGDFVSRSLFGAGGDPYNGAQGLRPSSLGNDVLTWEEAHKFDLGMEFAFLNSRIFGDFGVFNNKNKNLLLDAWLPTDSGFSSIIQNSGTVRNRGLELELGVRWLAARDYSWTTSFNYTYQENEIIELVDGLDLLGSSVRVGYPIDIIWDYNYAGINPADGRAFWYDKDGEITYLRESEDQVMRGKYSPDFYGGLTNTFSYKNLSLNVFFQYEYGRSTYNSTLGYRLHSVSTERGLSQDVADKSWQQPGDIAEYPRYYNSSSFPGSSSHTTSSTAIKDASYIRLKEMRLNYNLPVSLIEKINLTNANIFVQGRNLVTWTNYPYGDPEMVGNATGAYPQSRQIALGVNFKF